MVNHYSLGIELVHGLFQVYSLEINRVAEVVEVMKEVVLNSVEVDDRMVMEDSILDLEWMLVVKVEDMLN